jgi:hypothetical protein
MCCPLSSPSESPFAFHQRTPEVPLDEHVRRSIIKLGQWLNRKRLIYLDTNFWIALRQAAGNANTNRTDLALLDALRRNVASGKVLCPISASTFFELLKQGNPTSRLSTGSLIDELSRGIALRYEEERIKIEVSYLLFAKGTAESLHPLEHLVWCKLSYVLGFTHPTETGFHPAIELAIQKAFFDHMWTLPITEILNRLGSTRPEAGSNFDTIADELNNNNTLHSASIRSFAQAYAAEVRGLVDLHAEAILTTIEQMARKRGIPVSYKDEYERLESIKPFVNLLVHGLKRAHSSKNVRDILRTIHIHACLHAGIRWDKKRKLEANDLLDFHHAAAALAYCDAFFTEGPLQTLITQSHLALDKLYDCRVITSHEEALDYVTNPV